MYEIRINANSDTTVTLEYQSSFFITVRNRRGLFYVTTVSNTSSSGLLIVNLASTNSGWNCISASEVSQNQIILHNPGAYAVYSRIFRI